MTTVIELGFDGLNSSGKGTQLALFCKYMRACGVPCAIARGGGARRGHGLKPYDPASAWWSTHAAMVPDSVTAGQGLTTLNLQYQHLCRERAVLRRRLEKQGEKRTALVFDRSFLSRYFSVRQYSRDVSLGEALCVDAYRGRQVRAITPALTFVLAVSRAELLRRACRKETAGPRGEMVTRNLDLYELWEEIVDECGARDDVVIIDGEGEAAAVHARIIEVYETRLQRWVSAI